MKASPPATNERVWGVRLDVVVEKGAVVAKIIGERDPII